jgi:carboxymethylenebutenolidase
MITTTEDADLGRMRVRVDAPKGAGSFPGIVMYSDIFQITCAQVRMSRRLAGHGFIVATPEIWNRIEPKGTAIAFDDAGRARGLANASATSVADLDADARAVLDWLGARTNRIGAVGFCIGGHLAFRAAFQKDVRATACFYPTGLHDGKLGKDVDAGSLARATEIGGGLLMVFGSRDPHVPEHAREMIAGALLGARARVTTRLFDAEHAFMRDEGPRYDAAATDAAFAECVAFLRSTLS